MWQTMFEQNPAIRQWRLRVERHGWALRTAVLVTFIVVVIPLLALVLAAMLFGLVAFLVLSLVAKVMDAFGAGPGTKSREGANVEPELRRENVRVIREEI